jgi:hypothetical protein
LRCIAKVAGANLLRVPRATEALSSRSRATELPEAAVLPEAAAAH